MIKLKQHTLPNGMDVHYSSKANLDILQREFDGDLYHKHGIDFNEGDCIFDVGANIGFFVLYLNQHLADASVFSFEPIPETYRLLNRNTREHNKLRLQTFNYGLSDKSGTAAFTHYPRSNVCSTMYPQGSAEYLKNVRQWGLNEFRKRGRISKVIADRAPIAVWWPITELFRRYYRAAVTIECELRTISDVIDENEIQAIDYLKVDTEGAEMNVLRGIRPEHWPLVRQAVVEVHDGVEGLREVVDLLEANDFRTIVDQPCSTLSHLHMVYATRA